MKEEGKFNQHQRSYHIVWEKHDSWHAGDQDKESSNDIKWLTNEQSPSWF